MPYLGTIPNPTGFLTVSAKANSACVTSSAAFDQANNAVFKTGNTMTGNLVMSGANIAFVSSTNSGIYWGNTGLSFIHSPAANTLVFGTSGAEDMRLDSSGNLGIGNTSPSTSLHISAVSPTITLHSTLSSRKTEIGLLDSYNTYINGPNGGWLILNSQTGVTLFRNNGNEIARFEGNNLGIGTTSPTAKLHVDGNVTAQAIDVAGVNVAPTIVAAFAAANAEVTGVAAFGQANTARTHANAAFSQANTAYSSAVLKTGNTMTGNLVMSGANIAFATATNSGIYWGGTGLSFIHSPAANTLVFGTSGAEDMRLDSSGNLGIGTASPAAKLAILVATPSGATSVPTGTDFLIESTGNSYITFRQSSNLGIYGGLQFVDDNVGGYIVFRNVAGGGTSVGSDCMIYGTFNDHIFQTGTSSTVNGKNERMRITEPGRVGIGTSGPTATLHVSGNVTVQAIDISGANVYSYITGLPQNSQSAAYGLQASDAGKHILHPSADTTARTFTIPANSSISYPIGTAITFINQHAAGNVTIAITTDTMRLAGGSSTGNRTLVANGVATAIKITFTEWIISGVGLT
jgi:hypothetical protein